MGLSRKAIVVASGFLVAMGVGPASLVHANGLAATAAQKQAILQQMIARRQDLRPPPEGSQTGHLALPGGTPRIAPRLAAADQFVLADWMRQNYTLTNGWHGMIGPNETYVIGGSIKSDANRGVLLLDVTDWADFYAGGITALATLQGGGAATILSVDRGVVTYEVANEKGTKQLTVSEVKFSRVVPTQPVGTAP